VEATIEIDQRQNKFLGKFPAFVLWVFLLERWLSLMETPAMFGLAVCLHNFKSAHSLSSSNALILSPRNGISKSN
jgi:predicted membrane-bound spermidine synthase